MPRKRPKLKIVTHYMLIDGKKKIVNPMETNLPDRCKLALAEIVTGRKHKLIEG